MKKKIGDKIKKKKKRNKKFFFKTVIPLVYESFIILFYSFNR